MKRKHIILFIAGLCLVTVIANAEPTAATCASVFSGNPSQCVRYSLDKSPQQCVGTECQYICTCAVCSDGYHPSSGSISVNNSGWRYVRANTCVVDGAGSAGGGSTVRPKTCSTGSLCTICKGPNVTINGQIYCGIWADTKAVKTCSPNNGANVSYTMSPCCNSDGYAVGTATGCYVGACKTGRVPSDDKTSCVCQIGFYGTVTSECTQCPSSGGIYGMTAEKGKTSINDCFIPAGASIQDTTGTYKYSQNCYYK